MSNLSQAKEFLYFCIIGNLISLLFDIFRSKRSNFKTKDIVTYIEDIIYIILSSIIICLGIFQISKGVLRFYIFLGLLIGIIIYSLTFSKFCIIIIDSIMKILKKIIYFIIHFFNKIKKILEKLHI